MAMTQVRCQYCGHTAGPAVSACANCGAPLPEARTVDPPGDAAPGVTHGGLGAHLAEMGGRAGGQGSWPGLPGHHPGAEAWPHHHGSPADDTQGRPPGAAAPRHRHGVLRFLRSRIAGEAEAVVAAHHPKWQWRVAGGVAVAVLLVLAFLMVKSCALTAPPLTAPPGLGGVSAPGGDPSAVLPGPLREAACRPHDETDGVQSCVLAAGSPLLAGDITGGRALSFQVHSAQPAVLAQAIAQWRTASSEVVADGEVFAAISASSAVWYADTSTGLRLDTGAFAGSAAARTFLSRSGLLQP
ncbi:hypothetical protein [Nocardia carnea]|uniref:hypothetical protein n=1 Tax=Nocardia carnea TaxID=37328 RepID=UPI0024565939|nr:hypothetical protein [Nocardia carnea]